MSPRQGRPRASEFVFARLRYESGDWDYNPKVAANILNSVVEYTTIPVYPEEVVIAASSEELMAFPFLFMTGHKLVRFSRDERERLRRFVEHGGLLFSDDCNHDVNGLYARSFEEEMKATFPDGAMPKLPKRHPALPQFFHLRGRAADDLARAQRLGRRDRARLPARHRARAPARRAVQQQGLWLRVGLRLAQQAIPARGQHEVRRQRGRVCDDELRKQGSGSGIRDQGQALEAIRVPWIPDP